MIALGQSNIILSFEIFSYDINLCRRLPRSLWGGDLGVAEMLSYFFMEFLYKFALENFDQKIPMEA